AIIAPVAAIQRGARGSFVYVVKPDHTVEMRPVTLGPTGRTEVAVDSGLGAGEVVVVEGADKLREGTPVQVRGGEHEGASPKPGGSPRRGSSSFDRSPPPCSWRRSCWRGQSRTTSCPSPPCRRSITRPSRSSPSIPAPAPM